MISSVSGTVERVGLDHVVIRVGGVGLLVHVTPGTAASLRPGRSASLSTSLIVREDALTLYGFRDDSERVLFDMVQTVSGVGPRIALSMLAVHAPDILRTALAAGDIAVLTKVPGIGRKGAERLVIELRDKVGTVAMAASVAGPVSAVVGGPWRGQVSQALVGLGWTAKQAENALDKVAKTLGDKPEVPTALRAALRELGR